MPVKDKIVSWWIQNIIMPNREIIDKPGFLITTFTDQNQITYLRELFFAEDLFEIIENRIVEKYGESGRQALYSAGKKFGYIYSALSNFPTIQAGSKKDFSNFVYLFVRYCEGMFARKATHEINIDEKIFTLATKDYIICRHNGLGYIMNDGGSAGIWAYLMQDKSVEGVQLECEGRGDDRCLVMCSPEEKLLEKTNMFFCERDLPGQKFSEYYKALNEIREATYAKNSLKDLIDIGFFKYQGGFLSYKNMRFFGCESHMLYIMEEEISKLENGEQILFDACVEYGKKLREIYGGKDYQKFILDFFPALGFGEVFVLDSTNYSITSVYYPWTTYSENSKYIIFRGIMSGFVSSSTDKNINFNNYNISVSDYLTLTISV